jgi:hypothetical protein
MRANRRPKLRVIVVVLVMVIAVLCVRLWPHDRSLLSHATRIMPMPEGCFYHWLSDHTVLVLENDLTEDNMYERQVDHIFIHDITTGVRNDCPILTRLFQATEGRAYSVSVSPDGQRLLWISLLPVPNRKPGEPDYTFWVTCATIDGKLLSKVRIGHIPNSHKFLPDDVGWMADGQRWWELIPDPSKNNTGSDKLCVHTLDSPPNTVLLPFPADHDLRAFNDLRFTEPHALMYTAFADTDHAAEVDAYHIGSKIEWVRSLTLPKPPSEKDAYIELRFSASADQVCWLVAQREPAPMLAKWLHGIVPSMSADQRKVAGVFVGDLNGRYLSEVGITERVAPDYEVPLDQLAWTPDGHRISFIFKNVLYTVPID